MERMYMSYPVKIGNAEVVVASIDEAVELIAKYNQLSVMSVSPVSSNGHTPSARQTATLEEFVADLPEWPQKGLRMMIDLRGFGGTAIGADYLRRELGLQNNMALTGRFLTPLTRHANRAGIAPERLLITDRNRMANGKSETAYSIPDESLEAIKRGLGM
jgi:hypothetical protein